MQSNEYFAALPTSEIGKELMDKVERYGDIIQRTGKLALWRSCYDAYYGLDRAGFHEGSQIGRSGVQDELFTMKANHYRNLLTHLHILTTQQKPSFDARAANADSTSQTQAILANAILDYYLRDKGLIRHFKRAAEITIGLAGEAYALTQWDANVGAAIAVDVDTGEELKEGDIDVRVYHPVDVIRPFHQHRVSPNWWIIRDWEDRHDLLAAYPLDQEAQDVIRNLSVSEGDREYYSVLPHYQMADGDMEGDQLPVYTLWHSVSPACPQGRRTVFLSDGTVLRDETLERYPRVPIRQMMAYPQHGTTFGYTVGFDLLCVQEAIDILYSTVLTNQASFGIQNIWIKKGSDINPQQLAGGLNVIESNDKPEPLELTRTPSEIFSFMQGIERLGEMLSGINSVARGQPEASLKSGSALAMVASQAVQFSTGVQEAYTRTIEGVGQDIIDLLKINVRAERRIPVLGRGKRSYMKEFIGDDLQSVSQVLVDLGNPMTKTSAGQMQMADNLLQAGLLQRPEQYLTVMTTGTLEPALDNEMEENLQIDRENEALKEGKPVAALAIDQHVMHIKNHKAVLSGIEERNDPVVVQATLAHIQQHLEHLRTADPHLLQMLGMNPISMPDPATAGQQAPQPNAAPPEGGQQMPAPTGTPPEVVEKMPNLPQTPEIG